MLSNSSYFIVKPSRILSMLLLSLHAGAIAIACSLAMPIILATIITVGCVVSLWFTLQRHVFRKSDKKAIVKLWLEKNGQWQLQSVDGNIVSGELCDGSIRSNTFVLLNFKLPNKRFKLPVLIWKDALEADSFRRLRVLLRFTS